MDIQTNTRQIAEESNKIITKYNERNSSIEREYEENRMIAVDLIDENKQKYETDVIKEFEGAKTALLATKSSEHIAGLEDRLRDIALKSSEVEKEATEEKRKVEEEHNEKIENLFAGFFGEFEGLLYKRLKDLEEQNGGNGFNPKDLKDKEAAFTFMNKKMKKEKKKNPVINEMYVKLKNEIAELNRKKIEYGAMSRYSMMLPVRIHEAKNCSESKIEISIPLLKKRENCKEIRKVLDNAIKSVNSDYSECNKEEGMITYSFPANGEISVVKSKFEEVLKRGIENLNGGLKPRIYLTSFEQNGIQEVQKERQNPLEEIAHETKTGSSEEYKPEAAAIGVDTSKITEIQQISHLQPTRQSQAKFTLKEVAYSLGMKYRTLYGLVKGKNTNPKLSRFAIVENGKTFLSVEAVEYIKEKGIPAGRGKQRVKYEDKKIVSVTNAEQKETKKEKSKALEKIVGTEELLGKKETEQVSGEYTLSLGEVSKLTKIDYKTIWAKTHSKNYFDPKLKEMSIKKGRKTFFKEDAIYYLNPKAEIEKKDEKSELITMKNAAKLLGLSASSGSFYYWAEKRELRLIKKEERVYLYKSDVDKFIANHGLHKKEKLQKQTTHVPQEIKFLTKKELLRKAIEYIEKEKEIPKGYSWSYGKLAEKHYSNANSKNFIHDIFTSKKGKELRKGFEWRYADEGLSSYDIADKLKISSRQVCSDLQKIGMLTVDAVKKRYNTLDDIKNAEFPDIKSYPKDNARDKMLERIIDDLPKPDEISYLGLEGPNFASYISISRLCDINPKKSLVAEADGRAYNMMHSLVRNWREIKRRGKDKGGEIFRDLNIYCGNLIDVIKGSRYKDFTFEVINLDYSGYLTEDKIDIIKTLFDYNKIADNAVLFITLNAHDRFTKSVVESDFGTRDQSVLVNKLINEKAKEYGFKSEEVLKEDYTSRTTPMLLMGFRLNKKY